LAGTEAEVVEVEDADGVIANRIESPLGVVLVAVDGKQRATIRVRDASGEVLATEVFDGYDIDLPIEEQASRGGVYLVPHYTPLGRLRAWVRRVWRP
jgi:hypothetical protein